MVTGGKEQEIEKKDREERSAGDLNLPEGRGRMRSFWS